MGKENCKTVDSFSLTTESYSIEDDAETHIVTFQDREAGVIEDINRIIQDGQPCNMHIRYKDSQVEAVCSLDGCTYCEVTGRILCDKPNMKLIGYIDE